MNESHDPLELALASAPHVEDGGFTDRVLAALPPRRSRHRDATLVAAALAAALLGALTLGEGVSSAAVALGTVGATEVLLLGAAAAAAAGALVRAERRG